MLKYLQDGKNEIGAGPQYAKGMLRALPESPVHPGQTQPIYDVVGEPEWYLLGNAQSSPLHLVSV